MVDIVGLNNNTNQPNRVDKSSSKGVNARNKEAPETTSSSVAKDTIDIAAGAKEAQAVKRLIASAQAQPDVRADAVEAAKQKLANGGFDGRDVSEQAARKILG